MPAPNARRRPRRRRPSNRRRPPPPRTPPGPRRRGAQPGNLNALKTGLYARTLSKAALAALTIARGLQAHGLTEEIATLRAKLSDLPPADHASFVAGVGILARLVHADYRMNPKASADLAENLARVLNSIGDQLLPPAE